MCTHTLASGQEGMWVGRHSPEEYSEFFKCLDAAAYEHNALTEHVVKMVERANSTQTVYDISSGDTPVGHGFQVLGLLLMQAGTLNIEVADVLLSIPICAASATGDNHEREEHEERFKAAVREYKAAFVMRSDVLLNTSVDASARVHVQFETFPLCRGIAIKYRPRGWAEQMATGDTVDVPATVTREPFGFRPSPLGRAMVRKAEAGSADYEKIAAQGKLDRARDNAGPAARSPPVLPACYPPGPPSHPLPPTDTTCLLNGPSRVCSLHAGARRVPGCESLYWQARSPARPRQPPRVQWVARHGRGLQSWSGSLRGGGGQCRAHGAQEGQLCGALSPRRLRSVHLRAIARQKRPS
jgi:hypothetical protein